MPLIIFCGIPGSGKTQRALNIKKYFEEKYNLPVIHINEENMSMNKNEAYKGIFSIIIVMNTKFIDATAEKMTRGFLKSNVEKNLDKKVIVIVDSLNYIKGLYL